MVGELPPFDQDDEGDYEYEGLSALDHAYATDVSDDDTDLDVFSESYVFAADSDSQEVDNTAHPSESGVLDSVDGLDVPLFGVTNPPGTVTVTAYMDGRVQQIELSPKVINMTETDLADEILVIAGLAAEDARSAQYSVMLEGMREQGHDDFATRDFLTRELRLPTPDQADSARAEVFSTRYGAEHG